MHKQLIVLTLHRENGTTMNILVFRNLWQMADLEGIFEKQFECSDLENSLK